MAWLTNWYRGKRRRTRILLAALALCIIVGGVYWGLREVAIRIADHMTVTITRTSPDAGGPTGSIVYQRTFGRSLAADTEHFLNDDTIISTVFTPFQVDGGTLYGGPKWHYHLAFTWRGLLVETVDVTCDHLPSQYMISALGLEAPWQVWDGTNAVILQLVQASGGAIPAPSATSSGANS